MNYYERHLGDYARDTAHLSMLEHGAYSLLLDRYYSSEEPIPDSQAHRLARARTREEKAAVDVILSEFFLLKDGVWHHNRVDEEIQKARVRIENAKLNGSKGGRPRNPIKTQSEPSGFSVGSENETKTKALHTPDSIHQIPIPPLVPPGGNAAQAPPQQKPSSRGTRLPSDWQLPTDWLLWAQTEFPQVSALLEAPKFRDYWIAKTGANASKADWEATWRNWIRKAAGNNVRNGNGQSGENFREGGFARGDAVGDAWLAEEREREQANRFDG